MHIEDYNCVYDHSVIVLRFYANFFRRAEKDRLPIFHIVLLQAVASLHIAEQLWNKMQTNLYIMGQRVI